VEAQGDTCLALAVYLTRGKFKHLTAISHAFDEMVVKFGPVDFYQMVHAITTYEPGQKPPDPDLTSQVD